MEDPDLRAELAAVIEGLSDELRAKMHESAWAAAECIKAPDLLGEDVELIRLALGSQS